MSHLSLKIGILLGTSVFFFITQSVSASELLTISRSQEQAYCPTYYDKQFCTTDGNIGACVKGIEIVVETPKPTITSENISVEYVTGDKLTINTRQKDKPTSLNADVIFEMINRHRADLGLVPYEKEEKLCALVKDRGPELYNEIFMTGALHSGLYNRNLPWWITENMKYGASEEAVFNWWLSSSIHRKAIEGNYIYSCGECYGNSCAQLFTSYTPK